MSFSCISAAAGKLSLKRKAAYDDDEVMMIIQQLSM